MCGSDAVDNGEERSQYLHHSLLNTNRCGDNNRLIWISYMIKAGGKYSGYREQ